MSHNKVATNKADSKKFKRLLNGLKNILNWKCSECGKTFSTCANLRRHVNSLHKKEEFKCSECNKVFYRKDWLQIHTKSHLKVPVSTRLRCPICEKLYNRKAFLLHHFAKEHNINVDTSKLEFGNVLDFVNWKERLEKEEVSSYFKSSRRTLLDGSKVQYFSCQRSGVFVSESKGIRQMKLVGSYKINGWCPSGMVVHVKVNGEVSVTYTSTHIGHEREQVRIHTNAQSKDRLARDLAVNIPQNKIVEKTSREQNTHSGNDCGNDHSEDRNDSEESLHFMQSPHEDGSAPSEYSVNEERNLEIRKAEFELFCKRLLLEIKTGEQMMVLEKAVCSVKDDLNLLKNFSPS